MDQMQIVWLVIILVQHVMLLAAWLVIQLNIDRNQGHHVYVKMATSMMVLINYVWLVSLPVEHAPMGQNVLHVMHLSSDNWMEVPSYVNASPTTSKPQPIYVSPVNIIVFLVETIFNA